MVLDAFRVERTASPLWQVGNFFEHLAFLDSTSLPKETYLPAVDVALVWLDSERFVGHPTGSLEQR